jgi:hypothetical protein
MARHSPICQFPAGTTGYRKGWRPTLVTMSLNSTRDWPKASGAANPSVPASTLLSLGIACSTRSCVLPKPERNRDWRFDPGISRFYTVWCRSLRRSERPSTTWERRESS